jgi:hypothetical protein
MGSMGLVVHSSASGVRNVDTLFFMLGWARCDFDKKRTRTRYVELVFSHLVGYAGHVLHSSASGAQNVGALFFMLGWPRYAFHKMCAETCYSKIVFLHPV